MFREFELDTFAERTRGRTVPRPRSRFQRFGRQGIRRNADMPFQPQCIARFGALDIERAREDVIVVQNADLGHYQRARAPGNRGVVSIRGNAMSFSRQKRTCKTERGGERNFCFFL